MNGLRGARWIATTACLASTVAAVVACPVAFAHGGGTPGYTSTVTSVTPTLAGVAVTVVDRDDRLELVNNSGHEIVIEGYDNEPYLRFTPDGVYRNLRSPATYLNDDRYGNVQLPASANPAAEPEWELVTQRNRFEWHDHRIHWMSPIGPKPVRDAPDQAHHVFDWEVTGTAGGEPFTIAGSLDYAPQESSRPSWIYLALPLAAVLLAAGAFVWYRRKRAPAR
jgi:hypothetical protein